MIDLSLIVHTRNSQDQLPKLLSTTTWISDRIVVDMLSSDSTLDIAKDSGARVFNVEETPRVDGVRNRFLAKAQSSWTLVLDSDEYLAEDAESNILSLLESAPEDINAFAIPRYNRFLGRIMQGGGWYPDHQIRLFRTGTVSWQDSNHNPPAVEGGRDKIVYLQPPHCLHIHHDNYTSIQHFIEKQMQYALHDSYDEAFCFSDYVQKSYSQMARRYEPEKDGELSKALSLLMAWDSLIRGLVHWEKCSMSAPLGPCLGFPVYVSNGAKEKKIVELQNKISKLVSVHGKLDKRYGEFKERYFRTEECYQSRYKTWEDEKQRLEEENAQLRDVLDQVEKAFPWRVSNWLERRAPVVKRCAKSLLPRRK
jgi:glycosyltransferase involved in cell wall biosynthesis